MTGFGKDVVSLPGKTINIEIKSVNSKSFDFMSRVPTHYREKEPEIRSKIQSILVRGKVEFNIIENTGESASSLKINTLALKKHFNSLKEVSEDLGLTKSSDWLSHLVRIPDVLIQQPEEIDPDLFQNLMEGVEKAALALDHHRRQEGQSLENDFSHRIEQIKKFQEEIPAFENLRIQHLKTRFEKDLSDVLDRSKIDENRLEQELIYYMEKLDITEEKVRLSQHLDYFLEVLNEGHSQGKKLNFISQEIGRELNTLGSKANQAQIQHLIVRMKDELEKIKEQLLNIL